MSSKQRQKKAPRAPQAAGSSRAGDSEWHLTTIRRAAGPPLRFKGHQIARHSHAPRGSDSSISLWRRKSGGFVAAVVCGSLEDAASTKTIDEAMTWLERLCEHDGRAGPGGTLSAVLSMTPVDAMASRHFRVLAGHAMNDWDQHLDPGPNMKDGQ